jgi:tyrosyl-tRNA synthetase
MLKLRHLSQRRQYVCRQCIRNQHTLARGERPSQKWAGQDADNASRQAEWEEHASKIRTGAQQSMLSLLEERGFVKDIAGQAQFTCQSNAMLTLCSGRQTLDWLLTEKRIGVYVGVDPTAPSLHVGHLLPLMALYWMYLHGYYTVSLVSDLRRNMHDSRLIWGS